MNKVEKIRKEIERLKAETFDNKELSLEEIIAVRNCYNNLLFFIDSLEQPIKRTPADIEAAMQEVEEKSKLFTEAHKDDVVSNDTIKVVSNDLEEAAIEAFKHIVDSDKNNFLEIFKAGAQWQKKQLFDNRIKDCNNITEEQYNLESEFLDGWIEKYDRLPTFFDAIEYGMNYKNK